MINSNQYFCFTALPDVVHAVAKYEIGQENREIFFFREGSIVMWNISDLESGNLLQFLKRYEYNRYTEGVIHTETELMTYTYAESGYLPFFIVRFFYVYLHYLYEITKIQALYRIVIIKEYFTKLIYQHVHIFLNFTGKEAI